jgi:hypothetical protein
MGKPDLGAFRGMLPRELKDALDIEAEFPDRDPSGVPTNIADADAIAVFHQPTITPAHGTNAPGQQPDIIVVGATVVAAMTLNTDLAYRVFKIPLSFVDNARFHVHWTKTGDADESGKEVRWQLDYTVFDGYSDDISGAPSSLVFDDTYDDAGTTTRIVHGTDHLAASGIVANQYVGLVIQAVTPGGVALASEPGLVSVDMTFNQKINS